MSRRVPTSPRCSHHRGFTLLAVLVIVGSALLVTTSLLFIAHAEIAGSSHTGHAAQSRAMMESALEVIMQRLGTQRERILAGEQPQLDAQYELWESGGMVGIARLLPITPDGQRLQAEASRVDLNAQHLTVDMLIATGMVEPDVAQAIMSYRSGAGTIQSVAELLQVPGITAEMLYGPVEDLIDDDTSLEEGDLEQRLAQRLLSDEPRGLADIFTVFAVEPNLQNDGRRRINLNVPWSDDLGARLDERFGQGTGEVIRSLMQQTTFDSMAAIVRVLNQFDVPVEDWPNILDALTSSDETYRFGCIDLNSASEAALLALPEMTPETAAAIVRSRETLSEQERSSIAWPVMLGIADREAFVNWADLVSTRSWTYRLRLAVGEVSADEPEGDIHNPVIFEVVIDLAGADRPRVAYLRDISMLRAAAMLYVDATAGNPEGRSWYEDQEQPQLGGGGVGGSAADGGAGQFEEGAAVIDWLTEEESWPSDDLADERISDPISTEPSSRRRLGRWRGG